MHKTNRFGSSRNVPYDGRHDGDGDIAPVPLMLPFLDHCCCSSSSFSSRHQASPTGWGAGGLACWSSFQLADCFPRPGSGRLSQYRSLFPYTTSTRPTRRVGQGLASHVQQSRQQDDIPKGRALPGSASAQVSWLVGDPSTHTCKVFWR